MLPQLTLPIRVNKILNRRSGDVIRVNAMPMSAVLRTFCFVLLTVTSAGAAAADRATYYFPEQQTCTVLVDFQKERPELQGLAADARSLQLVRRLVDEFAKNGQSKCPAAQKVKMMAVYIPGVDNYGRPDFSNRVNLLMIEADISTIRSVAEKPPADLATAKSQLSVTVF